MNSLPHLYECSACGGPVKVTPKGHGNEPLIERACGHHGTMVYANRKVTLYGKGDVSLGVRAARQIRLTLRQLLSTLSGRSV